VIRFNEHHCIGLHGINTVICNAALINDSSGNVQCVELLLDHGAEINAISANNITALHCAAYHGHRGKSHTALTALTSVDCVQLLLQKGADFLIITSYGMAAELLATNNQHITIAELIRTWKETS